jgi:phosphoribosylformylglycinamidine synthase
VAPRDALLGLLGGLHLCSRAYLFRHYDSDVQGRTWLRPGEADAAVFRAHPERSLGIALAVGGNPWWCAADPELGARHAVAEAARNVACAGARPWALTDCLNFGRPEDAAVMGDLEATLEGLSVAAEALGGLAHRQSPLPFVSGTVSLYNQTGDRSIPPSPIVMCAGVAPAIERTLSHALWEASHFIVLVGEPRDELRGSTFAREILGRPGLAPPTLDLDHERRLQELAVLAAEGGWVRSAHDVSDGGLGIALAEMMLTAPARGLGIDVDLGVLEADTEVALFSERPAILYEVHPERAARLFHAARERSLLAWPIGTVSARPELRILTPDAGALVWGLDEMRAAAAAPLERLWNEETL